MGFIASLKSAARTVINGIRSTDMKVDPGGGALITAKFFSAPGFDSLPLTTDFVIAVPIPNSGGFAIVGVADPKNDPQSSEGEARIYGRDSAGDVVNEIHLKSDGSILIKNLIAGSEIELKADGSAVITNGLGTFELKLDGTIDMNGATVTLLGDVISFAGISLTNHVHTGVTVGAASTGPAV